MGWADVDVDVSLVAGGAGWGCVLWGGGCGFGGVRYRRGEGEGGRVVDGAWVGWRDVVLGWFSLAWCGVLGRYCCLPSRYCRGRRGLKGRMVGLGGFVSLWGGG